MGRIKRRSGASPLHGHTTPADEHPGHGSVQGERSPPLEPSHGRSPRGNRPQREHRTRPRSLRGFDLVLCADGLSLCWFSRREVWSLPAPVALAPSHRSSSLQELCPDFGPAAVSASCRVSDAHLVLQGEQGAGRAESQPGEPAPAPKASCSHLPSSLRPPPTQQQHPGGTATGARGAVPREHQLRGAQDTLCMGTPCAWEPPVHRNPPANPGAAACPAGAVALWGPGGEAALEKPCARALLHGCFREEMHSLPTFGSASHLVFKPQQDTAQAQQTSWSSRANFKQKRCLRNLQSHICSEQKHPPARNTAFQILPLISGSSNNLLPIQLLVLELASQY